MNLSAFMIVSLNYVAAWSHSAAQNAAPIRDLFISVVIAASVNANGAWDRE
jgi:hypothetical protein